MSDVVKRSKRCVAFCGCQPGAGGFVFTLITVQLPVLTNRGLIHCLSLQNPKALPTFLGAFGLQSPQQRSSLS